MDRINRLVEMGVFLDPQDAIRDSLRRTFRAYGLEPFADKGAEPEDDAPSVDEVLTKEEGETEKVPEDARA